MQRSLEQRMAIKFCAKLEKSAAETIPMLKKAFGVDCLSDRQIFRWQKAFAEGREDVNVENRAGRPSTSSSDDNVKRVRDLLNTDRRLNLGFLALTLVALKQKKQQKKKRRWSKDTRWYKMRNRFTHEHLFNFLRDSELEDYMNFLRMDQETFDYLLELVRPDIEKKDTNMREAIPAILPSQRLSPEITLRYLASGID
ncbi:hypothetical protein NQ318_012624 [Aromia moschata]|uniref:Mos1 transposase HTH domain-containing protein n=1 Tax=Aromia moschata TaxID=1265417 RepID=A0AAV8XEM5_9CUCU|nr:hypothetical protein NQ318_012624 [Aromia moschata]